MAPLIFKAIVLAFLLLLAMVFQFNLHFSFLNLKVPKHFEILLYRNNVIMGGMSKKRHDDSKEGEGFWNGPKK